MWAAKCTDVKVAKWLVDSVFKQYVDKLCYKMAGVGEATGLLEFLRT